MPGCWRTLSEYDCTALANVLCNLAMLVHRLDGLLTSGVRKTYK